MPCAQARHAKQAIKERGLLRDTHTHTKTVFCFSGSFVEEWFCRNVE